MSTETPTPSNLELIKPKSTSELLWDRAIYLSDQVQKPLVEYQNQLYSQVENMRAQRIGVPQFKLEDAELNYWRVTDKVRELDEQINEITAKLDEFEGGRTSEETLRKLLPHEETEPEKISKRRQAILREEERLKKLGIDPREIAFERHTTNFGADNYRFTTGRHQKSVHGSLNTSNASDLFFDRTTDTHGGKVSSGKRAGVYTTASGRVIRKS